MSDDYDDDEYIDDDEEFEYEESDTRPEESKSDKLYPEWIQEELDDGYAVSGKDLANKFFGVAPAGKRPVVKPGFFMFQIILVIVVEILIWAVYRAGSAPFFAGFGTHLFFLAHIIAAPTIHLGPIIFWWYVIRKERSFPFRLTSKRLLTGLLIGFGAAILWRGLQYIFYDVALLAVGGGEVTGFQFYNYMYSWDIVLLMTFVMFVIVGPVEEFEFRSFVHDQSARASPQWMALIISSVFFGCSHIPIAIFVYELWRTPLLFIAALVSWITAGAVFGVLYIYSRNIWACIVMHGMGNWILSIYGFGFVSSTGPTELQMFIASIAETLLVNAIMIGIFFLIHKFYWNPRVTGESPFGDTNPLAAFDQLITDLDDRRYMAYMPAIPAGIAIVVIMGILMLMAQLGGIWIYAPVASAGDVPDPADWSLYEEMEGSPFEFTGSCQEGAESEQPFNISSENVVQVRVTLMWKDEPDQRILLQQGENQPDTFAIKLTNPDGNTTTSQSAQNQRDPNGGEGSVTLILDYPEPAVAPFLNGTGDYTCTVVCLEAGDYTPRFAGPLMRNDMGNDYSLSIEYTYRGLPEGSSEE